METPKAVVETEPRKSLLILCLSGLYSLVIGIVVLIGLGSGNSQMAEGAGWIMIICGGLSFAYYVLARQSRQPSRR